MSARSTSATGRGSCAGPHRLRAGRHRLPAHAPRAGDPLPALRADHDRLARATSTTYGPGEPWFERGPDPVLATTTPTSRPPSYACCSCPRSGPASARSATSIPPMRRSRRPSGRRSSSSSRSSGREPQRRADPRRPARPARRRPRVRRARRELPRGARRAVRRTAATRSSTRHEGGAANMADAYGKLTGRPGICLVTRGPGATHAADGLHTALQDSTPMILLVGQVARGAAGREGFQELDYGAVFGADGEVGAQIDDAARIPEVLARAFAVATSGRPGPVVLALPEDMLTERVDVPDARPAPPPRAPAAEELERAARAARGRGAPAGDRRRGRLDGADRRSTSRRSPRRSASRWPRPSAARTTSTTARPPTRATPASGWTRRSRGGSATPTCCSRRRAAERDHDDGYTLAARRRSAPSALVHVHPDPGELGAVYQPELGVACGLESFAAAARALRAGGHGAARGWSRRRTPTTSATCARSRELPGDAADRPRVMAALRERLPPDAILTNGAGNFSIWAHRYYEFRALRRPSSRRAAARWATASRPRWPRRPCTPTAPWSASPATATSS